MIGSGILGSNSQFSPRGSFRDEEVGSPIGLGLYWGPESLRDAAPEL